MADEEWVDIGAAARFAARPLAQIALSRACLAISQRGGQFGAISGVRACLTVLLLLLVTQISPAGAAESAPPGTSIPSIAGITKIKIGYSTQQDIDAQWGEGKTIIGGHPNSGRLWRVKGTPWVIHTDGFEYSKRGLVVDSLELYEERKPGKEVPYARALTMTSAFPGRIHSSAVTKSLLVTSRSIGILLKFKLLTKKILNGAWNNYVVLYYYHTNNLCYNGNSMLQQISVENGETKMKLDRPETLPSYPLKSQLGMVTCT